LGICYDYANDNEKQKIINDLKSQLNQLFNLKEEDRGLGIELLKKEIAQIKESLKVRKKNKDDIVLRRLSEFIGNDDYMGW